MEINSPAKVLTPMYEMSIDSWGYRPEVNDIVALTKIQSREVFSQLIHNTQSSVVMTESLPYWPQISLETFQKIFKNTKNQTTATDPAYEISVTFYGSQIGKNSVDL